MTVTFLLLALAALAMPEGRSGSRVAGRRLAASGRRRAPVEPAQAASAARWPGPLAGVAAALGVLAIRSDAYGVVSAAVSAVFLGALIGPTLSASGARRRPADTSGLPLALELIAAGLRCGAALPAAAAAVSSAPGLRSGPELGRAATLLRLGADPAEAWAQFASGQGRLRARGHTRDAALLGAIAGRSARSGMRLAEMISDQAQLVRSEATAAAVRRAHRAGALALLPLGLCYLPAFICLGIVPMIAGLAASTGH